MLRNVFTADNSNRWIGQGPLVDEFEQEFAKKFGFKYCAMTNSGTSALHLAYVLSDIKEGDEVISTPLTCSATHHPLLQQKAKIIFADIELDTLNIDPKDIEKKITSKTKAIIVTHLGGLTCNINKIMKISRKYKVKVIEDASQSVGAKNFGKADFTCISFQAIKNLNVGGDGGMLISKNKYDHERAIKMRWFSIDRRQKESKKWQAWDRRGITFDQEEPGFKYQSNDSTAAIGLVQLKDIDWIVEHRKRLTAIYRQELQGIRQIELLREGDNSFWLFMIKVEDRDDFCKFLLDNKIETNVAHVRNDILSVFGGKRLNLPNMNKVEFKYICLPLHYGIQDEDVKFICKKIKEFYNG